MIEIKKNLGILEENRSTRYTALNCIQLDKQKDVYDNVPVLLVWLYRIRFQMNYFLFSPNVAKSGFRIATGTVYWFD
jgi:hypothetical protein